MNYRIWCNDYTIWILILTYYCYYSLDSISLHIYLTISYILGIPQRPSSGFISIPRRSRPPWAPTLTCPGLKRESDGKLWVPLDSCMYILYIYVCAYIIIITIIIIIYIYIHVWYMYAYMYIYIYIYIDFNEIPTWVLESSKPLHTMTLLLKIIMACP